MTVKQVPIKRTDKQETIPEQMKIETTAMLKAAAIIPDGEAEEHVTQQAGLIFDKHQPVSLVELELQLAELKEYQEQLKKELKAKQDERKKLPRFITDKNKTSSEDTKNV